MQAIRRNTWIHLKFHTLYICQPTTTHHNPAIYIANSQCGSRNYSSPISTCLSTSLLPATTLSMNTQRDDVFYPDGYKKWNKQQHMEHMWCLMRLRNHNHESFASFVLQSYVLLTHDMMQSVLSVSILLSLLSISMSLYLFCHSIYWKLFIFNCLCVLSDIMKLFTLIILVNAMDT
eukprot:794135_1